ncbi:TPA: CpaF family protein [Candidatus Woesearchaeota archaeon]|nr:CpaF family protein [Candidatus Woesearchaeota archaeon]HII69181.1 CpaF family protein [Candidatus Woesearchaeota archaeon]
MAQRTVEEYKIDADGITITIRIVGSEKVVSTYELVLPDIAKATSALLDEVKHLLVVEMNLNASEIFDPHEITRLKAKFSERAAAFIEERLPEVRKQVRDYLVGMLMQEMVGLGHIEFLLSDQNIEEIVLNSSKEPVRIFHKKYGWLETSIIPQDEAQIQNYANIIARRVGRQITTLTPLLDAHLVTGDRANAVLYPISNKGHTITIRKFTRDPWTVTDFINSKTSTPRVFALIWLAMQYEMNVLISGGTGSGKTSFLNVCIPFIPPNQRIISIEDTRELQLPKYLYWCPLTTRLANAEGKGSVDMIDLLINSLRMRPDRIILGEMRKKDQAEVLFEAMHTGHSVYATVHANTVAETIQRLTSPPISISAHMLSAVDLNIVMFRDRRSGIRRSFQIGEFMVTEEEGKTVAQPNVLFRWKPTTDEMDEHATPVKFYESLNRHAGLTQTDISKDLKEKEAILSWMVKRKIRDINDVGMVVKQYYADAEAIVKAAQKNMDPKGILPKEG